jgi:hypothetical protein
VGTGASRHESSYTDRALQMSHVALHKDSGCNFGVPTGEDGMSPFKVQTCEPGSGNRDKIMQQLDEAKDIEGDRAWRLSLWGLRSHIDRHTQSMPARLHSFQMAQAGVNEYRRTLKALTGTDTALGVRRFADNPKRTVDHLETTRGLLK